MTIKTHRRRDPKLADNEMETCVTQDYDEIHFHNDLFYITPIDI